ncbi:MAG: HAD-IA family hydrolase [Bacilli bacterium]
MFELILFDLDGTILDSDQMLVETFYELYEMYRPDFKPSRQYVLQFSGPPIKESLEKEFPHVDVSLSEKQFRERSIIHYHKHVKVFPEVIEFLEFLKKTNIKIGLITSKLRKSTLFSLELTKLKPYFELVIAGDDVKKSKPNPEGILNAMKYYNIKNKEKVLYIGDTIFDYLAATNAKIKFAIVSWTPRPLPKKARPHYVINSFMKFKEEILNAKRS